MDWKQRAEQLKLDENKSWNKTTEIIIKEYPKEFNILEYNSAYNAIRGYLRETDRYKELHTNDNQSINEKAIKLLQKGTSYNEFTKTLKVSRKIAEILIDEIKQEGYNIIETSDEIKISNIVLSEQHVIKNKWNGEKIIRFGIVGDTQINSKYTQITYLHKLYDIFEAEALNTVYHTGDIDEGEEMRVGHKYECYTQGADDHVKEICRVYPKRKGIDTYFITGNHDHSFIKRVGLDIGNSIQSKRDDMKYLGQSSALIYLTDNCTLELRHPIDGTAYALSYKIQKMIEAMSGGEKPNILAVGHYHKADYIFYRNIHAIQTGTLQAQTPFMRGKGIAAHMGGWIIEVHINDDGTINRFKQEFIPFYKAITNDYENWK